MTKIEKIEKFSKNFSFKKLDDYVSEIVAMLDTYIADNNLNQLPAVDQNNLIDMVTKALSEKYEGFNFSDEDNLQELDDQHVDGINREELFQYAMSLAHEVYGDDTDEEKVWKDVELAIKNAIANGGGQADAMEELDKIYTGTSQNFSKSEVARLYNI